MVLAAGRGERMRPLTDACPKPLLEVRGKPLLQWLLEALARAGITRVVLNTAWLGEQIEQAFGARFSVEVQARRPAALQIEYSREGRDFGAALETAGGICRALPLLCPSGRSGTGADVFWLLAADIFTPDFEFPRAGVERFIASGKLAHLWLVPNPAHHPGGDFGLDCGSALALHLAADDARPRYTYSTIGLYRKALFAPPWCDIPPGNPQGRKAPLVALLRAAMDHALVSAELYAGAWTDVGTPERLQQISGSKRP